LVGSFIEYYFGGYLYNGKRKIFGSLLLAGYALILFEGFYLLSKNSSLPEGTIFSYIAGLLFIFGFMYDAYREAVALNKR
jgi:hypothetical protein